MSEIESRTRAVMAKVFQISPQEITGVTARETLQSWDSLKHMTLILALEEEFGVEFSDKEIVSVNSLQLLLDVLRSKGS